MNIMSISAGSLRIKFQKVKARRVYRWVDSEGKKHQRSKIFIHTLSPFNKNPDGSIRNYAEVCVCVNAEADKWLQEQKP